MSFLSLKYFLLSLIIPPPALTSTSPAYFWSSKGPSTSAQASILASEVALLPPSHPPAEPFKELSDAVVSYEELWLLWILHRLRILVFEGRLVASGLAIWRLRG